MSIFVEEVVFNYSEHLVWLVILELESAALSVLGSCYEWKWGMGKKLGVREQGAQLPLPLLGAHSPWLPSLHMVGLDIRASCST